MNHKQIMGIKLEIEASLKDFEVTKINGQPTDENFNHLEHELSEMTSGVPTTNSGGQCGHLGLIIKDTKYGTFLCSSVSYLTPTNPGPF